MHVYRGMVYVDNTTRAHDHTATELASIVTMPNPVHASPDPTDRARVDAARLRRAHRAVFDADQRAQNRPMQEIAFDLSVSEGTRFTPATYL
jgi:hypothetical protein